MLCVLCQLEFGPGFIDLFAQRVLAVLGIGGGAPNVAKVTGLHALQTQAVGASVSNRDWNLLHSPPQSMFIELADRVIWQAIPTCHQLGLTAFAHIVNGVSWIIYSSKQETAVGPC